MTQAIITHQLNSQVIVSGLDNDTKNQLSVPPTHLYSP